MSAVETIGEPLGAGGLVPAGSPVVSGRVHLGRLRSRLPVDGPVAVLVGFGSLVWLGDPGEVTPPDLGRMAYRSEVTVDRRGRVVLDRRARAWLAVEDPTSFEALVMSAPAGGVLVVPVEDFGRRIEAVTP
jgi:hypothetical protein